MRMPARPQQLKTMRKNDRVDKIIKELKKNSVNGVEITIIRFFRRDIKKV